LWLTNWAPFRLCTRQHASYGWPSVSSKKILECLLVLYHLHELLITTSTLQFPCPHFMMINHLPFSLLCLLTFQISSSLGIHDKKTHLVTLEKRNSTNYNPDGTPFLWLPQDEYSGKTFYEYVKHQRRLVDLPTSWFLAGLISSATQTRPSTRHVSNLCNDTDYESRFQWSCKVRNNHSHQCMTATYRPYLMAATSISQQHLAPG